MLKPAVAATELLLISPAALFMTALFVRNLQPQQYEPAHTAQQIVAWFAVRPRVGLWGLLMALPLTVFIAGSAMIYRTWNSDAELRQATLRSLAVLRPHAATLLVALATCTAAGILAIVALHVLTD